MTSNLLDQLISAVVKAAQISKFDLKSNRKEITYILTVTFHCTMPKAKSSRAALIKLWIKEVPELTSDGEIVFCQACDKRLNCEKRFQIQQHISTSQHQSKKAALSNKSQQQLLTPLLSENSRDVFCIDLCKAMVNSNIPWNKLNDPSFREFLEKYCNHQIPSESTLRKKTLSKIYTATMDELRSDIGENYIWLAVDETTDSCGRYIANAVVGKMTSENPG